MFKTELHVHTKESSECSEIGAEEIIELYKKNGYSTLFITVNPISFS